jgi:hypothetical protein
MNPLNGFWIALKALLSLIFLVMTVLGVVAFFKEPSFLAIGAVLLTLGVAALPWVMLLSGQNRQVLVGWACIAVGLAILHIAYLQAVGAVAYPTDCSKSSPKGRVSCGFFNALAAEWGVVAVACVYLAISAMLIAGGFLLRRHARRFGILQEKGAYR